MRRPLFVASSLTAVVAAGAVSLQAASPQAVAAAPTLAVVAVTAGGDDGHVPGNVVDGDLSTRWSAEGDGAWIQFDLGADHQIGAVSLAWYRGDLRRARFDVLTADADAPTSWTTVVAGRTTAGDSRSPVTYDFADVDGRYVRVVGHGNDEKGWTSLTEAAVLGPDDSGDPGGDPPTASPSASSTASPTASPTPSPSGSPSAPTASPTSGSCAYPADVLDLTNWKETLPTGEQGSPTEIEQPALRTFAVDPWFVPTASCDGVQFRSAVDGVTTRNSKNVRSELREMTDGGAEEAAWSSGSGTHTMTIRQAITDLPNDKPQVVAGQIHDSADDTQVFRLEGTSLWLTDGDETHYKLITDDYRLGTPFEAKFVVSDGSIKAYYNGVLQSTLEKSFSGAYFKAGAYTQANCSNSLPCDSSNYGQVVIYGLTVSHS